MRIIAGHLKGRKLRSVRSTQLRPTADRVREAIFNILASHIRGARVLDLFAGTGALGIEALSRGAESAVFVDIDRNSVHVLRYNIQKMDLGSRSKILQRDPTRNLNCLASLAPAFELIFMDPPYQQNMIEPTLLNLDTSQCVKNGACIVVEHPHEGPSLKLRPAFETIDQRRYGKTLVSFLRYKAD